MEFSLCVSLFVALIDLKWQHSRPAGDIGGFSIGIGKIYFLLWVLYWNAEKLTIGIGIGIF